MQRLWLIFSQAVTVAVALLFVVATFKPDWLGYQALGTGVVAITEVSAGASSAAVSPHNSLAQAARRASPAVVSVVSSQSRSKAAELATRPFLDDEESSGEGTGSAVIVSANGYLITNNHVIDGADDIEVVLGDRRHVSARVIGTDPDSDLAVLKINVDGLPAITFGQVESLQVGDAVLAIGNPFNVGQTVTSGIVSAIGRSGLGLNTFENFIQTDAAINPGNSGGALVDVNGHLLGINTAIYSRTGGSLGIGFAIPASTARQVMNGLIRDGVVTRGWIGVQPSDISPDMARSLHLNVDEGVLITGVLQGGPASKAGMQPGDVVIKVAGKPVQSTAQLLDTVAALKPKSTALISVQRGDNAIDLGVLVAQRPRPTKP
jgi:Do/DeqQ family serine protease